MKKKLSAIVMSTFILSSAGSLTSKATNPKNYLDNLKQTNIGQEEYTTLRSNKITKPDDNDNDKLDFKVQTLNNQEYEIIGRSDVREVLNPIRDRVNKAFEENNYRMILVHGKLNLGKRVLELSQEGVTIIYNNGEIYIGQIL